MNCEPSGCPCGYPFYEAHECDTWKQEWERKAKMSVSPANDRNIDAWQEELDKGLEALESLEYAVRIARTLGAATPAVQEIDSAIFELEKVVSRAALKVGRLKRAAVQA